MYLKSASIFFAQLLAVLLLALHPVETVAQYSITVTAGGIDRAESVVSVTFPDSVAPGVYALEDGSGNTVPIQVNEHNMGLFIIDKLSAGDSEIYHFSGEAASSVGASQVNYTADENTFTFQKDGKPVLSYYYDSNNPPTELDHRYKRAGYIHPAYTPNGVSLTNHLDTQMHPHHYGIWSAWTKTKFQGRSPDFWNQQDETGRVDHADSLDKVWEGPVYGGLKATNYFVDISGSAPVIGLNEEWQTKIYNISGTDKQEYNLFDLKLTHTANSGQPLTLPTYHYGGLAFRGHQQWDNPDNVSFLTSAGYDRSNGNETRARWVHVGGQVNGKQVGVAILSHPDNFRSPQPVRINPSTPYFVYAPMQLGDFKIKPGSPYLMRYRFVTYDGEPDVDALNHLWKDYAYPPGVTVTAE
ncbi:PmoA family protein [Fodinibius salsisoli]|uniref:PmoA family protein n=1 Tax=Fodinibius salsisoli TaxID=2820877 RepID=A0ABT3PQV4_9BACT|nr:PmoA family protein [Fodinibius salsisoli]MCW9708235.1 PmoA family protein [Fodinibius salsisoli]